MDDWLDGVPWDKYFKTDIPLCIIMSHLSFEGQSKVSYCLECSEKHGQTAKILLREALQRATADGPDSEGVVEKVRGVVEELSGFEDDTNTVENPKVSVLNNMAREIRKTIYASQAEIGGATMDILEQVKKDLDHLVDETYNVRQTEECPTCKIEVKTEKAVEKAPSLDEYGKSVSEKRRQFLEEIRGVVG